MMLHLRQVLTPDEVQQAQTLLTHADWLDGRSTAGSQAMQVKHNEQLRQDSETAQTLRSLVMQALGRHALFHSAALPKKIFNPLFNRYGGQSNHYGPHIDGAVMNSRSTGQRVRSDLSATLFLSDPLSYEGGELVVHDTYGQHQVKLPAGDLVLYPASSLHEVLPVTRGERLASFFWIESMVRSGEQRHLLYELDMNLLRLRQRHGESDETQALTGLYHNLLRQWADS